MDKTNHKRFQPLDVCNQLLSLFTAFFLMPNVQAQGRCAALSRSVPWSAVLGKRTSGTDEIIKHAFQHWSHAFNFGPILDRKAMDITISQLAR